MRSRLQLKALYSDEKFHLLVFTIRFGHSKRMKTLFSAH